MKMDVRVFLFLKTTAWVSVPEPPLFSSKFVGPENFFLRKRKSFLGSPHQRPTEKSKFLGEAMRSEARREGVRG
jgi:hypothetical protein